MPGGPYATVDHVTVTLQHSSGLVRDAVVNSFVFEAGVDIGSTEYARIETALDNFYSTVASGALHSVSEYLGVQLSRSAAPTYRHYRVEGHLDGSAAGSPVRIQVGSTMLDAPINTTGFPSESAVVLGFHGPYVGAVEFAPGARPRSRRRGRIYLGPLCNNSAVWELESGTNRIKVNAQMRTDLLAAGKALFNELATPSPALNWVVWSRKNTDISTVLTLTVDDAFDVQRRRGERPMASTSTTVP